MIIFFVFVFLFRSHRKTDCYFEIFFCFVFVLGHVLADEEAPDPETILDIARQLVHRKPGQNDLGTSALVFYISEIYKVFYFKNLSK